MWRTSRPNSAAGAFVGSQSGLALTEFAILLPVLVILYFGTIETTQSVIAKRRLNLAVSTMGDLTARVKTVSSTDITNIFGAAGAIMAPISTTGMPMRISSVIVYPTGQSCVDWSVGSNMTTLSPGSSVTLPSSITSVPSTSTRDYILAEGSIAFSPITHNLIPGSIQLHEGPTYLVPRQSDRVLADSTIQASSPCA